MLVESRRAFLKYVPSRAAGVAVLVSTNCIHPAENTSKTSFLEALKPDSSLLTPFKEGIVLGVGNILLIMAADRVGIRLGGTINRDSEIVVERMTEDASPQKQSAIRTAFFVTNLLASVTVTPIIEEYLFRDYISRRFVGDRSGDAWDIGIKSNLIFALVHNFTPFRLLQGKLPFRFDRIALPQFIQGMFYWKKYRDQGLRHSIVMHQSVNLGVIATYLVGLFTTKRL